MIVERIYLRDNNTALVNAWKEAFRPFEHIDVQRADFFQQKADAMVSPANSFGIMDGGLDLAIRYELGYGVENRAQRIIVEQYHGEMPVGCAEIIATGNEAWPHLIIAPTMRIPENVTHTTNAYLAFRAVLLAIKRFNQGKTEGRISSVVVPGLCTGVGNMPPRRCAAQMRLAYNQMTEPSRIPSFDAIHRFHRKLRTV